MRITIKKAQKADSAGKCRAKPCKGKKDTHISASLLRLRDPLNFENLLIDISTRFINIPIDCLDEEILAVQQRICESLGLDICGLWQFQSGDPLNFELTHMYVPPDFLVLTPETKDAKISYPWCLEMLLKKEVVVLSRITDAPASAATDLKGWKYYGVKSVLTFPLFVGDGPSFGALNFNAVKKVREWSREDVSRLRMLSQIFANGLNRKFTERTLRQSSLRLKLAADSANAGLWFWDHATDKIWVTDKTRSLYGFLPDEEITGELFYKRLHPDDLERVTLLVEKAFRLGEVFQIDYRIVLLDQSVRWMSVRAQSFLGSSGMPESMTGVSFDITERRKSDGERTRLRTELAHMSRVMTMNELSNSLAHEINQPLGAILNNAQAARMLLLQMKACPEEFSEIIEDIVQDAKRAGDVIRRTRAILKKGEVQFMPLDINILIRDVVELCHHIAQINKIKIRVDGSSEFVSVYGDRVLLQQVLMNIIINALEAMKPQLSGTLVICSGMNGPDTVLVSITDSGPGIDKANINSIFESFFTTKKDGLGMGLRICRSIIEQHGGKIWAENVLGGGVSVAFSLKAWKGERA
jgi:PAS domain S-box-containing protein